MVLDIDLFRVEKGGNPDNIKKNQAKRFKDESCVDKVVELDVAWRKCKVFEQLHHPCRTLFEFRD